MRRFILGWKRQGWAVRWAAHIVSYADDYVILCRHHAQEARKQMERIMERIGLTVNQEKTRTCGSVRFFVCGSIFRFVV